MSLKLNSTGGGSVTLDSGSTANNVTITLPGVNGTMATLGTVTNNGVVYVNSSGQPTSGSALTFDGTTLGVTGVFKTFNSAAGGPVDSIYTGTTAGAVLGQFRAYGTGAGVTAESVFRTVLDGGSITSANFQWLLNTSEQMRLTSTGLGIGTSSPLSKFHSNNSSSGATALTAIFGNNAAAALNNGSAIFLNNSSDFNATTYSAKIYSVITNATTQSSDLIFGLYNGSSGQDLMRLDSSGNLGLGVTPSAWVSGYKALQVGNASLASSGTPEATVFANAYGVAGGFKYISSSYASYYSQYNGSHAWAIAPSGTAGNAISFTQAMTLDASGNLGIGTNSPADILNLSKAGDLYLRVSNTSTGINAYLGQDSNGTYIGNTGASAVRFIQGSSERMRITSGGEVYIAGTTDQGAYNLQCNGTGVWGAGAYVNGSDARLKEEVADIESGLDVVTAMRPVTFRYKEEYSKDQSTQPGFIAQELQAAMQGKNYLDGVVQSGPEYLNVAYQNLIPILTKAIQELKAELDELKAKVN